MDWIFYAYFSYEFIISLGTLKQLLNQSYWDQIVQQYYSVFWCFGWPCKTFIYCTESTQKALRFSKLHWLDSGFSLPWSCVKKYWIIRGMWCFQLERIQRFIEKLKLFTEYQYIYQSYCMMTLYALYTVLFRTDWSCAILDMVVPYPN